MLGNQDITVMYNRRCYCPMPPAPFRLTDFPHQYTLLPNSLFECLISLEWIYFDPASAVIYCYAIGSLYYKIILQCPDNPHAIGLARLYEAITPRLDIVSAVMTWEQYDNSLAALSFNSVI